MCRSKHVQQLRNIGIINSAIRSHLVGYFYMICIMMHGSVNIIVSKLLKVKPINTAVVSEFQLHDSAKGVDAYSVIPLPIIKILLPTDAQENCFKRSIKIYITNSSNMFQCNYHHQGAHYMSLLRLEC